MIFEVKLNIKPLSVNEAWQGSRFKTKKYLSYEKALLLMLPKREIKNVHTVFIEFGFSSKLADIDNPVKLILDILQKKYGFNDRDITELNVKKTIVKKSEEFIKIKIE
jgi:Holliday junction resolvase RusA-like endonuclease